MITLLYKTSTPVKEIQEYIERQHGFRAEIRQYRSRLSQWKLDRNIKTSEMQSIVRKRQRRKLLEPDKLDLTFQVRGYRVNHAKIVRWMNANDIPESMLYSPTPAVSTPSAVGCHTVSNCASPGLSIRQMPRQAGSTARSDQTNPPRESTTTQPMSTQASYRDIWISWLNLLRDWHDLHPLPARLHECKSVTIEYLRSHRHQHALISPGHILPRLFYVPYSRHAFAKTALLEEMVAFWTRIGINQFESAPFRHSNILLGAAGRLQSRSSTYMAVLIRHGANVHAVDHCGRGALHNVLFGKAYPEDFTPAFCAELEDQLVILLDAGCDPNATDSSGMTPGEYAGQQGGRADEIWGVALEKTKGRRVLLTCEVVAEFERELLLF